MPPALDLPGRANGVTGLQREEAGTAAIKRGVWGSSKKGVGKRHRVVGSIPG